MGFALRSTVLMEDRNLQPSVSMPAQPVAFLRGGKIRLDTCNAELIFQSTSEIHSLCEQKESVELWILEAQLLPEFLFPFHIS